VAAVTRDLAGLPVKPRQGVLNSTRQR
jgi:hypothetical protein